MNDSATLQLKSAPKENFASMHGLRQYSPRGSEGEERASEAQLPALPCPRAKRHLQPAAREPPLLPAVCTGDAKLSRLRLSALALMRLKA